MDQLEKKSELLGLLKNLPSDTDPRFQIELRKIGLSSDPANIRVRLSALEEIAFDPATPDDQAFSAFLIAFHNYRRRNKASVARALLARGEPRFRARRLFQLHQAAAGGTKNPADFHAAISIARLEARDHPSEPAVLNAFSELVAKAIEEQILEDKGGALLTEAKKASETSIAIWPDYAKYRATYARLLVLEGDLVRARQLVDAAIELEDDLSVDFNVRLSGYLAIRQRIFQLEQNARLVTQFESANAEMQSAITAAKREIEESRMKNIEVLAFFTAIIALILTGTQEARSVSVQGSQSTILMLGGVLTLAFGTLSLILYGTTRLLRMLTLVGLGAALTMASIFVGSIHTNRTKEQDDPTRSTKSPASLPSSSAGSPAAK